jgi:hypothetical protein
VIQKLWKIILQTQENSIWAAEDGAQAFNQQLNDKLESASNRLDASSRYSLTGKLLDWGESKWQNEGTDCLWVLQ